MSETVYVWTQSGCSKCEYIKSQLSHRGITWEERQIDYDNWRGCVSAMATLQLHDGQFPVVKNGHWMSFSQACEHFSIPELVCDDGTCSIGGNHGQEEETEAAMGVAG